MIPWSGLSLTPVQHAYEMGTLELHRTSIMLAAAALTTNRSKDSEDLQKSRDISQGEHQKYQKSRYGGSFVLRETN